MNIADAQSDMRLAYYSGATGAFASGLAWLVAGIVSLLTAPILGVVALYAGGMFIFPVSVLLSKMVGRSGKHSPGNPLARLAMEGTLYMLLCFPAAVVVFLYNSAWFFPAMLLNIAGRYLTFQTIYGIRLYWVFSLTLASGAIVLFLLGAGPATGALVGGAIELLFAVLLFLGQRRDAT